MLSRRHEMPFGAAVLPEGGVRFRLWAPAARTVGLSLERDAAQVPLRPAGDGWFELIADAAAPGDLYRYVIDGETAVPDPASRFQPEGVHGASEIVDPAAFAWPDGAWLGRPWEEAVIYELHVGAFTAAGDYRGVEVRLDHLVELGVTAVELMPLAATPGQRNWGYDGVDLFAPDARYGRPEALKSLVAAAHRRGLMVLLDVVYNHFGPEGNYLHRYAPPFFAPQRTPWGEAIDYSGAAVRAFFTHNALYWLEEYNLDGLRLDAAQAMRDDSTPHILEEIATAVHEAAGRGRHIHLVLENDDNAARYLARADDGSPRLYTAQWNDDFHHVLHGLLTGEADGHYRDHQDRRPARLGRVLTEGFDYQGEPSVHRSGRRRGEPSAGLPPTAFVAFLQNHDHVGNRAFGERLGALAEPAALRGAIAILLLAPSVPLLFMGEEWQADEPFLFFSDLAPELAAAVRDGRRRDFAKFRHFADPALVDQLPDPQEPANLARSTLRWAARDEPGHRDWLDYYRRLLEIRRAEIVPRLAGMTGRGGAYAVDGARLTVAWRLGDGSRLGLTALLDAASVAGPWSAGGRTLFATHRVSGEDGVLPPWFVRWSLAEEPQ
jgi:maltooligosyltrehalose trehalohydrolase